MEPIATTVATLEPHTSANMAHATIPANARPPWKWPMTEVAKSIMRRATPPWVRKLPARMKNGTAMISNFSMPVNSFRPTASIGTCVMVNRNVSTVRPSAIEIGIPVSISATRMAKMIPALPSDATASSMIATSDSAVAACFVVIEGGSGNALIATLRRAPSTVRWPHPR